MALRFLLALAFTAAWVARAADDDATAAATTVAGRHAHWVLRVSDLERSVGFYEKVFGMRVLRHEENSAACPITCNGNFQSPWSKTMMGYRTEDVAYALELTYNYAVTEGYPVGEGLRAITIAVPDVAAAAAAAAAAGFKVEAAADRGAGSTVVGPDGYRYPLIAASAASSGADAEPFAAVTLRVSDVAAARAWYTDVLGMSDALGGGGHAAYLAAQAEGDAAAAVVGYPGAGQVPLVLAPSSPAGAAVHIEQFEGRHALSLPADAIRAIVTRLERDAPERIVHEMLELEEALGTLLVAIVRDLDGFELCLVSSETFDPAVLAAADFVGPDYARRAQLLVEYNADLDANPYAGL